MMSHSASRRQFLKRSALVALAPTIPSFLARSVRASDAGRDATVLVVIQLDGGNDGINTVVPYKDEGYAASRQQLRLPTDNLIKLSDEAALHPRMRGAGNLFHDGRLAIVQGVGYPNPNRSHFQSMAIWHSAMLDAENQDGHGWLGQALGDTAVQAAFGKSGLLGEGGLQGPEAIYVGAEELPVALRGRRCHAASIAGEEDLHLALEDLGAAADQKVASDDLTGFVERTVLEAYASARELSTVDRSSATEDRYPSFKLAVQLQLVSQLIKSGATARVYYTSQSGYDTHAVQLPTHANLLDEFSSSLAAFLDDLKAAGLDQRVLVVAFSEFGRRVSENGSLGTDHGTAGPVFLAGPRVKPGLFGKMPPLTDLDDGDLKHTVDFRQVYAAVLDDWLGLQRPDSLVSFEPIPVIRRDNVSRGRFKPV